MSDRADKYRALLKNVVCNLCGSDSFSVIYPPNYGMSHPDRIVNSFKSSGNEVLFDQLVRCQVCGLQYLNPRLREDLILEAYSAGADETFISQLTARERTFNKCLNVIEHLIPARGKILDVGTAGGSFLDIAKKRGWEVAGCEPNRWLSEWGGKHYNIPIHAGTIFDMNLNDASFDVVTLWDALEHTPDPKAVLLECRRVLKPNGLLAVNYPDIESLIARLMGRKWVFLLSTHLYYFTTETIQKMLELTEFRIINHRRHWQSLELNYILFRMKPYLPWASSLGIKAANALHLQNMEVPYWMGQILILARSADKNSTGSRK